MTAEEEYKINGFSNVFPDRPEEWIFLLGVWYPRTKTLKERLTDEKPKP